MIISIPGNVVDVNYLKPITADTGETIVNGVKFCLVLLLLLLLLLLPSFGYRASGIKEGQT